VRKLELATSAVSPAASRLRITQGAGRATARRGVECANSAIGDTGAPTKRQKIDRKNNALQRAKTQSSTGILGPESVLAIEVFGRSWQSRTSSGGVAVEIAQLRPRVLIDARRS
jgi:hypothetical protein